MFYSRPEARTSFTGFALRGRSYPNLHLRKEPDALSVDPDAIGRQCYPVRDGRARASRLITLHLRVQRLLLRGARRYRGLTLEMRLKPGRTSIEGSGAPGKEAESEVDDSVI